MGPAVLVTLGVLFLLTEFWHMRFQWPVLLIVIGLVKVWQSTTSQEGHMQNYMIAQPTTPPANSDAGQVQNG
jgi:hypothetical protein